MLHILGYNNKFSKISRFSSMFPLVYTKTSNFNSRWALLRCVTHFNKIGLKPVLLEKRWLAAIIMTCKRTQSIAVGLGFFQLRLPYVRDHKAQYQKLNASSTFSVHKAHRIIRTIDNGLLFHMTQPTNRSTTRNHYTEQNNHNSEHLE